MSLPPGCRLGPYEILAPIGAGGMGEVLEAKDTRLHRTVAVKVLPSHLSSDAERKVPLPFPAPSSSPLGCQFSCDLGKGHRTYLLGHWESRFPGVDHIEAFEAEIVHGFSHGAGDLRRDGSFKLESETMATANNEKIQFGS